MRVSTAPVNAPPGCWACARAMKSGAMNRALVAIIVRRVNSMVPSCLDAVQCPYERMMLLRREIHDVRGGAGYRPVSRLIDLLDVAGLPCLVEKFLFRPIEAQDHEET